MPVRKWFDFDVPLPAISKDFIESAISRYENRKAAPVKEIGGREIYWLGSRPVITGKSPARLGWFYMQEMIEEKLAPEIAELLWNLRPSAPASERQNVLVKIKKSA